MDNEEQDLQREIHKEISQIRSEFRAFMMRISIIANLLIPGLGFLLLGKGLIKGIVSFVLYVGYGIFYIFVLLPIIGVFLVYEIPFLIIIVVSTYMLSKE